MQAWELKRLILGDDFEFWQSCANYCTVMKAAVAVLKEFDGKQPCMDNVYMIMRALRHHMAALHNAPFNMPSDLMEPFEVALRNREALVVSDLHYAGTLLNPHLIKDMELRDDQNAMAGLMRVFQRLTDTAEEFQAVKGEFNLYFHTMSPYCGEHVWSSMGVKEVPHLWWYPRPHVSGITVATPSCIAKRGIDYFHLVRRTWCMSTPTHESLIKMCHLQIKRQQNGTCKLLYPRTLILRDLRTFLMITTMFPTLTHQTCPSTMRISKGD
jgi:hypothetical protein